MLVAENEGVLLAGNLYFADNSIMRWIVGASRRFEEGVSSSRIGWANAALIWEAIKMAKEKGLKEFDLGGCYVGPDKNDERHIARYFKEKFGGTLREDYVYHRYYGLYGFLRQIAHLFRSSHG